MKVKNQNKGEVTLEITLSSAQWSMLADRLNLMRGGDRPQPLWLVTELPDRIREAL